MVPKNVDEFELTKIEWRRDVTPLVESIPQWTFAPIRGDPVPAIKEFTKFFFIRSFDFLFFHSINNIRTDTLTGSSLFFF